METVALWGEMLDAAAEAQEKDDPEERVALEYKSLTIWNTAFAKSLDPDDERNPVKFFPNWLYLQQADQLWLRHRFTLWAKSRRLFFSWRFIGNYLWDSIAHRTRYTFFQSRELSDAGMDADHCLLWRANFIWERLPKCIRPKHKVKKKLQLIEYWPPNWSEKSTIRAVSADFDAFRSFPVTGALLDEVATQQHPELAFVAVRPAVEKRGRITGVSTPNGENFFHRAIYGLD